MTSSVVAERRADPEWTQGDRFRKVRVAAGYTQRDFADALEVKHATYAAWEADRTTCPRIQAVARRIEVLTGVRAAWLLDVVDPVSPPPSDRPSPQQGRAESSTRRNSTDYPDAVLLRPLFRRSPSEVVAAATTAERDRISA